MPTPSKQSPKFSLSKWYMDCVSDEGDVFIGYSASLRWRRVTIHYSSVLRRMRDAEIALKTSLQKIPSPVIEGSSLHWPASPLRVEGRWSGTESPIERTLLQSDEGDIEWRCLQPHAIAEIRFDDGSIMRGLGYAEHISISIPPWRLPIDELRWGRFLSNDHGVVWIDWRGPSPLTLILHDGAAVEGAVGDDGIALNGGRPMLAFDDSAILREGYLVNTALSMIPGIGTLFPASSLRVHERKWRSRGILREQGKDIDAGWTIHEIVRFR